jgi:uncharacterized protein YcbX
MLGEELNDAEITERGLLGDRQFAVVDPATGKVRARRIPANGATSSTSAPPTSSHRSRDRSCPPSA